MSPEFYIFFFASFIFLIVSIVLSVWWLRRKAIQSEEAMRARFPTANLILRSVNFIGQESNGVTQLRGNGTLALTSDGIHFERWVPRKQFHIPAAAIKSVETPRSFLGKSLGGRPLLRVVYVDAAGKPDSMTWYVTDLESVKQQVERLYL